MEVGPVGPQLPPFSLKVMYIKEKSLLSCGNLRSAPLFEPERVKMGRTFDHLTPEGELGEKRLLTPGKLL